MAPPEIAILLPYAEHFGPERAGAVALQVRDGAAASRFRDRIRIYGKPVPTPFAGLDFRPLQPAWQGRLGDHIGLAEQLYREIRGRGEVLVELHNRPNMFRYLAVRSRRLPLTLRIANDPQAMRGARSPAARQRILDRASAIFCVSDFIRRRFLEGLGPGGEKVHVLYTGIERTLASPPEKRRLVLYVGRINPDKGVADLVSALERVLPHHPGWQAEIVGTSRTRRSDAMTPYEEDLRRRCAPFGDRVQFPGLLTNDEVFARYQRAAIAVVPSRWAEPLARSAIEALAHGCAVVAYPTGGLPEILAGRALLVERPAEDALAEALGRVIADDRLRARLQEQAWVDYPFTVKQMASTLDDVREQIFARMRAP